MDQSENEYVMKGKEMKRTDEESVKGGRRSSKSTDVSPIGSSCSVREPGATGEMCYRVDLFPI
jgi:hypothetical protein